MALLYVRLVLNDQVTRSSILMAQFLVFDDSAASFSEPLYLSLFGIENNL